MRSIVSFVAMVLSFALATSAVVWSAMSDTLAAEQRLTAGIEATDTILTASIARESALRGYAQTRLTSFLEPYDAASADLAGAADRARDQADGEPQQLWSITQQERLASRWAGSANDAIIRVRNGDNIPIETAVVRSGLIAQLRQNNEELRALKLRAGEASHGRAVRHAVLLVLLLSVAFTVAGALVARRIRHADDARRAVEREDYEAQRELAETLQITETEVEAHALVKRHLERSVRGGTVLVLNRNNSHDRLEPATPVDPHSPIAAKLIDSSPRSCLAIRLGRAYAHAPDREPLLACGLCSHEPRSTCIPSLVGGEVIGSVLVGHRDVLTDRESAQIAQSVSQAAPVLANLRNLAVAELRATTDGLTGLPNARSLRESLVRMIAQATRSGLPLSAILCDLDHFKQINDLYGHEKGDQALAAASAVLHWSLRESDLAGRYGGEEFLVLLPDTSLDGAVVLAEKLRGEIAVTSVPGVDRTITASFGVASFPDDTVDGELLLRVADRALYAAKARGRNCVVTATELVAESVPA